MTGCLALALAACGSSPPAPVVDLRPAPTRPAVPAAAPAAANVAAEAKPGYYTVKKSDTLYSIALEHGQAYRDVAAWNGIDDPNKIHVGQQLRVIPPETAAIAETRPVVSNGGPVEVRADAVPAPAGATVAGGGDAIKREPKGGKQPYSEQALAMLQKPEPAAAATPLPHPPGGEAAAESAASAAAVDGIDWVWPVGGKVVAPFVEGTNKGVDLSGREGDPVVAAAAGKVVYVGTGIRGYGKMIIVKHNAAFLTVYAHNSQILVKEDQMVTKGQKIAEVGSSDADRALLHFEIRHLNKPVDPLKYLPGRS